MVADWISLGIGVAQAAGSELAPGTDGVFIQGDVMKYYLKEHPTQAPEKRFDIIDVSIMPGQSPGLDNDSILNLGGFVEHAHATIQLAGEFAEGGDEPPVLA